MLEQLKPYTKTVVAFVIGCLQVLALYFTVTGDGVLDAQDKVALVNAAILAIGGTGAVYALPNKKRVK